MLSGCSSLKNFFNVLHSSNILFILVIFDKSHVDILGNDFNDEQL